MPGLFLRMLRGVSVILASRRSRASDGPMFGGGGAMGFVELFGAVRTFEFVPLTGHANQGNRRNQNGEKFHRAAS